MNQQEELSKIASTFQEKMQPIQSSVITDYHRKQIEELRQLLKTAEQMHSSYWGEEELKDVTISLPRTIFGKDISNNQCEFIKDNLESNSKNASKTLSQQEKFDEQQIESIRVGLDDQNDLSWTPGTDYWHFHEIKPQREIFRRCSNIDAIKMTQHTPIQNNSQSIANSWNYQSERLYDETAGQLGDTNSLHQQCTETQINDQQKSHLRVRNATITRCGMRFQRRRLNTKQKFESYNILLISNMSKRLFHNWSYSYLLKSMGTSLVQFLLFISSTLLWIGITHDCTDSSFSTYGKTSTFNPDSIGTKESVHEGNFLEHSLLYIKTIKILRDLESLLIYSIT